MILSALIAVTCGSFNYGSKGLFVCGSNVNYIRAHIPTEQVTQLKVIDNQIDYGVMDFNIAYEEKGFWLFKKKFLPIQDSPSIEVTPKNSSITIGLFSQKTGKQFAIIDQYTDTYSTGFFPITYTCDRHLFSVGDLGKFSFGEKVGGCIGLVNSESVIEVYHDKESTNIRLEGCTSQNIDIKNETSTKLKFRLSKDLCPLYVQVVNKTKKYRAKIVYFGYENTEAQLDTPIAFDKKAFKPITATLLTGEWYYKGKIEKRFSTTKNSENIEWFTDGTLCLFAYSELGISSEACYNKNYDIVPFYFR